MSVAELLELVRVRGVEAFVRGDRLVLRPASKLSPEILETLRMHKAELLTHLRRSSASRVGPWQPPGAVTRTCPSCGGGLQPHDVDNEPCFTCMWVGMSRTVQ